MATKKIHYNKRIWLNPPSSSFTGFLVCYAGKDDAFLRIGDCDSIANIHMGYNDVEKAKLDYIKKITLIRDELTKYINCLNEVYKNEQN